MWPAFHLPAFNGEGDVDEWISKLECFFNTVAIHEDSHKILYAANYLTGPAHAKWRALHHQDGAATTTWEDFKNLILRCFKPCAAGDDAATAIKQKELSVGEYTDNFLDSRKLNRYISGLNPPLANFVNLRKPRNLQEAITLALQAERAAKAAAEAKPKETPPLTARYYQSFVALPPKKEEQPPSAPKKDVKLHFVVYSGDDDFGKWQRGRVNGHTVSFVASNSSDNFVSESAVSRLGRQLGGSEARVRDRWRVQGPDGLCRDEVLPPRLCPRPLFLREQLPDVRHRAEGRVGWLCVQLHAPLGSSLLGHMIGKLFLSRTN